MPFDFYKMDTYAIDYEDLLTTLLSFGPLLNNHTLQEQFMTDWVAQLKRLDAMIVRQMNRPTAKRDYLKSKLSEPEVYQVPIYLGANTFQLLFRIPPLIQILSSAPDFKPTALPASTFTDDTTVHWDKLDSVGKTPPQMPIIMAPSPIGIYRHIVIDGNHRLSVNIADQADTILAYTIAGQTLINANLLSCGFDRALYAMILEFQSCKQLFDTGVTDSDIISKSMLRMKEGQFSFPI